MQLRLACCLLTVLLTGCGVRPVPRELAISIRWAETHEPVAGADVRVTPVRLFLPSYPHETFSTIDQPEGPVASGTTGADGATRLRAPSAPWALTVTVVGESPRRADLDDVPADGETWLALPDEWGDAQTVEVRVTDAR